ncbi:uncharacterized protein LOC114176742 isoform X3 [Vigna unguiculata]|uniref:uncharacterized protein LOC114176742 isoform X3 n=1 Tax=Vigna unguiculata TaxID=3917 RepID=UPI00101701CF|nr:uncharacterized protein LOC114176742 isoform X3 [Vigna unguiculata]XP_027917680.1 uncharacterized protein LOC114176742 isoform X3 [Vigna unguiculata]
MQEAERKYPESNKLSIVGALQYVTITHPELAVNKIGQQILITRVHSCTQGLCNLIREAKEILNELEGLLGDVTSAIQTTDGKLLAFSGLDFDVELIEQTTYNDLEEKDALSHSQSPDITSTKKKKSVDVTHLAMVMAFIYSMVKQDYLMQEKIVSALDLKMSSEELESYCQMWSLRPFINDEIVNGAWEHIH